MQCTSHALVCAALLFRQGDNVTTRAGSALVVYPNDPKTDKPHLILKHWWITASNGLCDLSLSLAGLSAHKPVIFRNMNLTDPSWRIVFKDDFRTVVAEASKSLAAGVCGVFYQTDKKRTVSKDSCEADLLQPFPPTKTNARPLRYIDIVRHCERLIDGGESVRTIPQEEIFTTLPHRS